jgi:hypothetical protein
MQEQYQPKTLDDLNSHGSAADGVPGVLQEIVGEGTKSRAWSWHSGFLSGRDFLGVAHPSTKSSQKPRRYL